MESDLLSNATTRLRSYLMSFDVILILYIECLPPASLCRLLLWPSRSQFPVMVVLLANRDSHYCVFKNSVTSTWAYVSPARRDTIPQWFGYSVRVFCVPPGRDGGLSRLATPVRGWGEEAGDISDYQQSVIRGGSANLRRGTFLDLKLVEPLSRLFHSQKMHLLAFWALKWQISLLFHILELVKSPPFEMPKAWERYPLRAEPPRLGHYREYLLPPPPPPPPSGSEN